MLEFSTQNSATSASWRKIIEYRGVKIPDKIYYRIGELAHLLELKTYVLRYWETEFPSLKPLKSKSGHRLYKKKHVFQFLEVKHLLYTEKYSIQGAKKALWERSKQEAWLREPNLEKNYLKEETNQDGHNQLKDIGPETLHGTPQLAEIQNLEELLKKLPPSLLEKLEHYFASMFQEKHQILIQALEDALFQKGQELEQAKLELKKQNHSFSEKWAQLQKDLQGLEEEILQIFSQSNQR